MPTRDRMATPFHWLCPWETDSYPRPENASDGNASSGSFVSCRHTTSGWAYSSHSSTRGWRALSELTFQVAMRTGSTLLPRLRLPMVTFGEPHQYIPVDLVGAGDGDAARGHRLERGRTLPALQHRALAEDRARTDVRERLAIDDHAQHSVEEQEQLVTGLSLFDERGSLLQRADLGLGLGAHDPRRQLTLERGLDRRHERPRVAVAPRGVLPERVAVPVLEIGQPDLRRKLAFVVVHPVARELARADHFEGARTVGTDRERKRGPDRRRLELDERRVLHPAWCRETGASAGGLHEARFLVRDLRVVADVGERYRLERRAKVREPHARRAHEPSARISSSDDPAILHVDPRGEMVCEPEHSGAAHLLEVVDLVGRWFVVVGEPHLERSSQYQPGHRFRRDPGDARHGRFHPHRSRSVLDSSPAPTQRYGSRGT